MDRTKLVIRCMSERLREEMTQYLSANYDDPLKFASLGYANAAGFVLDLLENTETGYHFKTIEKELADEKNKTKSANTSQN